MDLKLQKLVHRKHILLTDDIFIHAMKDTERFVKVTKIPEFCSNTEIIDGDFLFDADWMKKITENYQNEEPCILLQFIEEGQVHGEKLVSFARNLKNNKKEELENLFKQSVELLKNIIEFLPVTHPLAKSVEIKLRKILQNKGVKEEQIEETLMEISTPEKLNGPAQEIKELREIKIKSQQKEFNLNKAIKEHAEKYAYLGYRQPFSPAYDESFFLKRLEKLEPEINKVKRYKVEFTKQEQIIIDMMKEFVYFR